jgi:hypothetical protein
MFLSHQYPAARNEDVSVREIISRVMSDEEFEGIFIHELAVLSVLSALSALELERRFPASKRRFP